MHGGLCILQTCSLMVPEVKSLCPALLCKILCKECELNRPVNIDSSVTIAKGDCFDL